MKNKFIFLMSLFATSLCFTSCGEDEPTPDPSTGDMRFVHSVVVGDNAYVSLFNDLDIGQTNTKQSLVFAKEAFIFTYKKKVYVLESMNSRLYKYGVSNGTLTQEGATMIFPAGAYPACLTFDSEEKAYISCIGLGNLWVINPSLMKKTGEIDLSSYTIGADSGDKNPEPGASVIKNGILYVGLAQEKSQYNPNAGIYVVLINTKTDKPIKMISDSRATMASYYPAGDPFVDENGDIYIYGVGAFGYLESCTEGFLRIKNGETEFDKSYYFPVKTVNIPNVNGNTASYVYNKEYTGNGKVYAYLSIPGNVSNPPDYVNDKSVQAFEIDIYNKSLKKLDFEATTGWVCSLCKYEDYIVWGMASAQGTGYCQYNYKTDSYEPVKIKTEGTPLQIQYLK